MRKVTAIARKELLLYFSSPMAYIILILTIAVFNVFFYMIIGQDREVALKSVFQVMEFMFIFLIPILTMRLLAEERASGTIELLLTSPLTPGQIVVGKYLGALAFFSVIIAMTLSYYALVEFLGHPDRMAVLTGYAGIWLEGAFFLAVGLMTSSWTRHQTVAAIAAYAILFTLYFSVAVIKDLTGPLEILVRQLSTWSHLENLATGLVTAGDLVYYVSATLLCLWLARLSLKPRGAQ